MEVGLRAILPPVTQLLYLDSDLIALNKDRGVATEAVTSEGLAFLPGSLFEPGSYAEAIHRIDQPTSGILLIGRNRGAVAALSAQLKSQTLRREYWAICQPPGDRSVSLGRLEDEVLFDQEKNKSFVVSKSSRTAVAFVEKAGETDRYWVLRIELVTGRHHQIRAQLAARGMPVVGDLKYGAKRSRKGGGIYLHARSVTFAHPSVPVTTHITAPVSDPDRLWQAAIGQFTNQTV